MINHLLEEVDTDRHAHIRILPKCHDIQKILTTEEITCGAEIKGQISGSRRMAGVCFDSSRTHTHTHSRKEREIEVSS